jgi:DNA-binding NtrC family response regulator
MFGAERERLLYDEEMLAALGYEPVGFERPADAIAACRSAPDRFDVILVSHAAQTPVGLDLARSLHELAPRQPMLLATASTIDVSVEALAEAGISRCAAPAPGQHRTCRGASALPAVARHVTTVTRLPKAEMLL